jgi:hypothetical protein
MLEPPTQCRGAPAVEACRCWNACPVRGRLILGPWTARRSTRTMLGWWTARLRRVLKSACCFWTHPSPGPSPSGRPASPKGRHPPGPGYAQSLALLSIRRSGAPLANIGTLRAPWPCQYWHPPLPGLPILAPRAPWPPNAMRPPPHAGRRIYGRNNVLLSDITPTPYVVK